MKSIFRNSIAVVATAAVLLAFSPEFGGEGFEISLNSKVLIQKYGPNINDVNSLQLDQSSLNGELTVKYHHCGKIGKNRVISMRDGQDKIVKEWRFTDAREPVGPMTCKVKDILALKKANSSYFKMYYSSTELPKGRLLTGIAIK